MLKSWIYKDTQLYREDSNFRVISKSTKMVEKQSGFLLLFVAVLLFSVTAFEIEQSNLVINIARDN